MRSAGSPRRAPFYLSNARVRARERWGHGLHKLRKIHGLKRGPHSLVPWATYTVASADHVPALMERETRFELATSTLATGNNHFQQDTKNTDFSLPVNDIGHPSKQAHASSGKHKKAKKPEPRPKPAGIWSTGIGHDVADSPENQVGTGPSAALRVSVACFRRLQVLSNPPPPPFPVKELISPAHHGCPQSPVGASG